MAGCTSSFTSVDTVSGGEYNSLAFACHRSATKDDVARTDNINTSLRHHQVTTYHAAVLMGRIKPCSHTPICRSDIFQSADKSACVNSDVGKHAFIRTDFSLRRFGENGNVNNPTNMSAADFFVGQLITEKTFFWRTASMPMHCSPIKHSKCGWFPVRFTVRHIFYYVTAVVITIYKIICGLKRYFLYVSLSLSLCGSCPSVRLSVRPSVRPVRASN